MAQQRGRSAGKRVGGLALMLLAVAMMGISTHFRARRRRRNRPAHAALSQM